MIALDWLLGLAAYLSITVYIAWLLVQQKRLTTLRHQLILKLETIILDVISESIEKNPNDWKLWLVVIKAIEKIPTVDVDITVGNLILDIEDVLIYEHLRTGPIHRHSTEFAACMKLNRRMQERLKVAVSKEPELIRIYVSKLIVIKWIRSAIKVYRG